MSAPPPLDLEEARRKLRELGYLNGRVERFLFTRAFEGRRGLLVPAVLAGALAAAVACVAAVASVEADFASRPSASAILLLHLTAAYLLPVALAGLALGAVADRSRAPAAGAALWSAASAALVFAVWIRATLGLATGHSAAWLLGGFPVALAAFALASSVRSGYLARAYAHSRTLPTTRRRVGAVGAIAAAALLLAAGLFTAEPRVPAPAPLHVSPRSVPILVVAVDGIPDRAHSEAQTEARSPSPSQSRSGDGSEAGGSLAALLAQASSGWWPQEAASPAEVWTTISTGVTADRHGVRALERVRPLGSPSALRAPFGAAWYLRGLGPALGLVTSAPVSASDRRVLAFWEVSASAGLPSCAIGWWASGPWPGASVTDNRQILARASRGEEADAAALAELARHRTDAVSSVYLAGPDILRTEPARRAREIEAIASFLEPEAARARAGQVVLVVVTVQSHGAAGALGRLAVFDGRAPSSPFSSIRIRPTDVAPSVLARAGVPAARDLEGRPVAALFREGSLETLTVPTYGPRHEPAQAPPAASDREYIRKLKALGYLN